MPITTPDLATTTQSIASGIATRLPGADASAPRSVLGVLTKVLGGTVDGLYGAIQQVADNIIYDTADRDYLVRWAAFWGLRLKTPTPATGTVTFSGASTVPIPAGTTMSRSDGLVYQLVSSVTLVGNAGTGTVICTSAGAVTNTDAGATLTLTSPISGVSSTVTVGSGGLSAGADIETTTELLGRLLLRIQQTPQGGSAGDFEEWALGVSGVTRAWVFPGWNGAGTVGVTFMCDDRASPIPQAADVAAVQAAIDALRPVAATTYVFAPTPVPLNFTIHLNPGSAAIEAAVAAELASLIANQCAPGGTLPLSHIWASISSASGENDFTLSSPTGPVTVPAGSITTMGVILWV